jgi:hypothetical protein
MPPRQRRYSLEEHARRGEEIYQQQVRPLVEAGNRGKIVAIDIDSGAFEVADDMVTADTRLFARFPDAQVWYVRIGYPAVDRFSYVPPKEGPA